MPNQVDAAFVKQYEARVHHLYQKRASKLRNTVRRKPNVTGSSTHFKVIGKGRATEKTRHGVVPPMNVDHSQVECALKDRYAGEWVDKLDEFKGNHDEQNAMERAGAWALGREADNLIVTDGLVSVTQQAATTAGGFTKAKALEAHEILGDNDVFEAGRMWAIVGWKQWGEMLSINEFANADFVGDQHPWLESQEAKRWLGTVWMPLSGLPKTGNDRTCFWYHEDAVGIGEGARVTSDITWHGDRAAHFVNNMMSMGACLIDGTGGVKIIASEV